MKHFLALLPLLSCVAVHSKTCHAISVVVTDAWCNSNCNANPPNCPAQDCRCDSSPTPPPPPPPVPTPITPTPAPGPSPVSGTKLVSYFCMPSNRTGPCKGENGQPYSYNTLTAVPNQYNVINVAFAVFDPFHPGQVVIQGLSDIAALQLIKDIKLLQSRGTKVMLAFGGQDCNWSGVTAANTKAYAGAMVAFIEKFGFDGADLDNESVNAVVDELVLIKLVRSLRNALGKEKIITLTPQDVYIYNINAANHTFNTYQTVLNSVKNEIDWVNIMAYNNGIDAKVTYETWASGFSNPPASWGGFPASKLVLGLLNSKNSGNSGFLPASTACDYVKKLKGKYSAFGGVMTWCTNAEDGSFVSAVSECLK